MVIPARPQRPQRPVRALSPQEAEALRLTRLRETTRRWYAALPEEEKEREREMAAQTTVHPRAYRIVPCGDGWYTALHPFGQAFTYQRASSVVTVPATVQVCAQTPEGVRALMWEHHKTWKEHKG